jgi:hypothetical protein
MSSLGDRDLSSQACMRPCAPDSLPIIGPIPTVKNGYVCGALNCWGICWAVRGQPWQMEDIYGLLDDWLVYLPACPPVCLSDWLTD